MLLGGKLENAEKNLQSKEKNNNRLYPGADLGEGTRTPLPPSLSLSLSPYFG